jgi:general secretion pathway protein A
MKLSSGLPNALNDRSSLRVVSAVDAGPREALDPDPREADPRRASRGATILQPMYADHFGLQQGPFSIAPDPRFLFMSERHREALAHLLYGLGGGGGFVLLTGEIGAGKTTVCRCFLEQIPKNCNVAYIFNPKLTVIELVRSVCDEFRIPYPHREPGTATVTDYLEPLNSFLLRMHAIGKNNVLIIDEAQNLSADVLEQLRLMTNLETSERKLLQIILIGQPELRDMLARSDLQQLAQRVIARFHLEALSEAETLRYIRHRLSVSGLTGTSPFAADTLPLIHKLCRGVPRRINLLCDRAMLGAYAGGRTQVDQAIVEKAAGEVFDAPSTTVRAALKAPPRGLLIAALGLGLALGAALAASYFWMSPVARDPARSLAIGSAAGPGHPGSITFPPPQPGSASSPLQAMPVPAASAASAAIDNALASTTAPRSAGSSAVTVGSAVAGVTAAALPPPAAASVPATGMTFGGATGFAALHRTENDAWRDLAALWQVDVPAAAGDVCAATAAQQRPCFRFTATTLATVRQLDRPGILTLRDASGRAAYVLVTGISADSVTLRVGESRMKAPLGVLSTVWRGEFSTLWQSPAGYTGPLQQGAAGPVVDRLATQLGAWSGQPAPAGGAGFGPVLKARLANFQRAQGLQPDGVAGPTTFMQINRWSGIDEPRLLVDAGKP